MTKLSRRRSIARALVALVFLPGSAALAADAGLDVAASQTFLATHAKMPGVTVRPDGMQYRVLKQGFGRHPGPTDTVELNYSARLVDGAVIDGTSPGLPASIAVNRATPGLAEALLLMRGGDHWEVTLPPDLAFGAKGNGAVPPDQAVIFDVTLLSATAPAVNAQGPQDGLSVRASAQETGAYWTIHQ